MERAQRVLDQRVKESVEDDGPEDSIRDSERRDRELEELRAALAEQRELAEHHRIEAAETRTLFDAMQYRLDALRKRVEAGGDGSSSDEEESSGELIAELRQTVEATANERDQARREVERLERLLAEMPQASANRGGGHPGKSVLSKVGHSSTEARALWQITLLVLVVGAVFVMKEPASPGRMEPTRSADRQDYVSSRQGRDLPGDDAPRNAALRAQQRPLRGSVPSSARSGLPKPAMPPHEREGRGQLEATEAESATVLTIDSWQLVDRILWAKVDDGELTSEQADRIHRLLLEARENGVGLAPALREILSQAQIGSSGEASSSDLAGSETVATLQGILDQVGGQGAGVGPLLERLAVTTDPMEIAMLARELEEEAPGQYRDELLAAARETLDRTAGQPPEDRADVSPLFELLEVYGGVEVLEDLRGETSQWWQYRLIALAGMPDGAGVSSLVAQASDPRIAVDQRSQLPFQLLAQAATNYSSAGDALVELARSKEIPDRAWRSVAAALEGMHLQFPLQIFDEAAVESAAGLPEERKTRLGGFEAGQLDVRYDLNDASKAWSDEQLDHQLTLIEKLLEVAEGARAVEALQEARSSLLRRIS